MKIQDKRERESSEKRKSLHVYVLFILTRLLMQGTQNTKWENWKEALREHCDVEEQEQFQSILALSNVHKVNWLTHASDLSRWFMPVFYQ